MDQFGRRMWWSGDRHGVGDGDQPNPKVQLCLIPAASPAGTADSYKLKRRFMSQTPAGMLHVAGVCTMSRRNYCIIMRIILLLQAQARLMFIVTGMLYFCIEQPPRNGILWSRRSLQYWTFRDHGRRRFGTGTAPWGLIRIWVVVLNLRPRFGRSALPGTGLAARWICMTGWLGLMIWRRRVNLDTVYRSHRAHRSSSTTARTRPWFWGVVSWKVVVKK